MADSLTQLAINLTRIIVPIIMFIGITGNSLNIAVLTRPALYNHACSRYFLAVACVNLLFTSIMLPYRLLADGYQLDVTKYSLLSCKLVTYFYQSCILVSAYYIVLASIDRYCGSSTSAYLRKFSNIKMSRWAILFITVLCMLFYSNTAILIDLRTTDTFGCRIRGDTSYKQVYPIMQIINIAIIAPGLMALFGIMTICNTKRVRVIPTAGSRHRRTENQLAVMLLIQVCTYIVLMMPTCVTYIILVFPNPIQTTTVFYFARMMSQLLLYSSSATSFLLYLISARTYRKELVLLFYKALGMRGTSQVYPSTNTVINTTTAINTTMNRISATRSYKAQSIHL